MSSSAGSKGEILLQMEQLEARISQVDSAISTIEREFPSFPTFYKEQQKLLQATIDLIPPSKAPPLAEPSDKEVEAVRLKFAIRKRLEREARDALDRQYIAQFREWKLQVAANERSNGPAEEARLHTINSTLKDDSVALPAFGISASSGATTTSANRRRLGPIGDVVRSEEEMNCILRDLLLAEAHATALTTRWKATLATVPDQVDVLAGNSRYLHFADKNRIQSPAQVEERSKATFARASNWSLLEQRIFCERFFAFPKQFGKIAEGIPGRTAQDAVKFYYCSKKRLQLKRLQRLPTIAGVDVLAASDVESTRKKRQAEVGASASAAECHPAPSAKAKASEAQSHYWTKNERRLVSRLVRENGPGHWTAIANVLGTKSESQVRRYYRKYMQPSEPNKK